MVFTPSDPKDYNFATAEAFINVEPSAHSQPLVTVTGVKPETVHLSKRKTEYELVITFSGALDPAEADNVANYHLAVRGKGKNSRTYSKPISIKSAMYGPTPNEVTLQLKSKLALAPAPQLRITAAGLLDANGRALDGNGDSQPGGDYVALVTSRGAQPQIMSGPESFARRPPRFLTKLRVTNASITL